MAISKGGCGCGGVAKMMVVSGEVGGDGGGGGQ